MPREIDGRRYLSVKEAAKVADVVSETIRRWIRDKEFNARKVNERWWIDEASLERFLGGRSNR